MKNTLIVEKLEVDNCEILLDKAESLFLSEEVIDLKNNNMLDIKNLNRVLKEFQENKPREKKQTNKKTPYFIAAGKHKLFVFFCRTKTRT